MKEYLRLFRLGNGAIGIVGVVIGAVIAVDADIVDYLFEVLVGCAVVVASIAGGNSLNDYVDREIDKAGHPDRPLPKGEIEPATALCLGIVCLAVAIAVSSLLQSVQVTGMVIAAVALMVAYEALLKQRGFVGNIVVAALTGMVFLFGGSIVGDVWSVAVMGAMSALVNVGREIAKDIEDMGSDEGRQTLPMALGARNAAAVGAVFFIAGPALSVWPLVDHTFGPLYCLVFVADAIFIYTAFIIFRNAHKAQKLAKIAMLVALAAFVLGVVL
ncbi:MAG: geranylgeranylglycerol-phosphate geranylgeranyltransferase [Candidatus Methanoplasma sp.]|jgi:geranylgeranylglycerol-phosphate geranylgeranyltransferase|nr:geranylgeranylglycerol-phosphate geranylgeranyltransferase [Candidatus Methanoplasma sp.]